jgi:hypothetical protein
MKICGKKPCFCAISIENDDINNNNNDDNNNNNNNDDNNNNYNNVPDFCDWQRSSGTGRLPFRMFTNLNPAAE